MSFNEAVNFVLVNEGGYSDHPNDSGGETHLGISQWAFNEAKNRDIIRPYVFIMWR